MGTPLPYSEGPPPSGRGVFASANIVDDGKWEPWTSSAEDAEAVDCDAIGTDDEYGASATPKPDIVRGRVVSPAGERSTLSMTAVMWTPQPLEHIRDGSRDGWLFCRCCVRRSSFHQHVRLTRKTLIGWKRQTIAEV